ncbi:hypothetical protein QTP88_000318 [Uroleucon formosanum]
MFFQINTYAEIKRSLIKFCETSATETEELLTSKPRVRIQERRYSSSEEETSFITTLNNTNLPLKIKGSIFEIYIDIIIFILFLLIITQQTQHTEVQKGITNIPKPKSMTFKTIDFFGADDEYEDCTVASPEMSRYIISIHGILNNIGHALKTLKKEIHVIKVDVMKNQEIFNSLAENDRHIVAILKMSVQTISELNEIEEDEDRLSTLVNYYNARSFDATQTIYMAMKLIMQNRVSKVLNMEARRREKTVFVKYKIYITLIGVSMFNIRRIFVDLSTGIGSPYHDKIYIMHNYVTAHSTGEPHNNNFEYCLKSPRRVIRQTSFTPVMVCHIILPAQRYTLCRLLRQMHRVRMYCRMVECH